MASLMNTILALPAVRVTLFVLLGILVALYVLSIIWVARDAYLRDANWIVWTIVAIIPIVGLIAYCMLRPSLYQIDKDEQELEIAVKKRELQKYGTCSNCGYPVESDYVLCPNCLQRLKNLCPTCGRALDPSWRVCPYCGTTISASRSNQMVRNSANVASLAQVGVADIDEPEVVVRPAGSHVQ